MAKDPAEKKYRRKQTSGRKKRLPITAAAHAIPTAARDRGEKGTKTSATTRALIRQYHTLTKRITASVDPEEIARLQEEQKALGGLEAYQRASVLGASKGRGGDTSRWLVKYLLQRQDKVTIKERGRSLRLLDVGALSADNYAREAGWIDVVAIDLNSRDPRIIQGDFLHWESPTAKEDKFDVVCLSLVVNFLGDPIERGDMLRRVAQFLRPPSKVGPPPTLFLVLPRPCVDNSRYMSAEHLEALGNACGYRLLEAHLSNKLAHSVWEWDGSHPTPNIPRRILRTEGGLNNFSISLLPPKDASRKQDGSKGYIPAGKTL